MRMLEARAGEAKMIKPMLKLDTGDGDPQIAHLGEIRQPHLPGHVHLAEDHLALRPVQCPPGRDPSLERATHAPV